jgi:hypothetical protein
MRMDASRAAMIAMAACMAVLAALYAGATSTYWSISPDSATYVGYAKTLAAGWIPEAPPPQPPVTSLLYAPVLAVFPDGYLALNTLTRVLMFAALALFHALLTRRSGPRHALLVVVLTLASVSFYQASTQLLSEPAYMLFSAAALLLIERVRAAPTPAASPVRSARVETYVAGVFMVLAVMTRTAGVALPLAVLVSVVVAKESVAPDRRSRTLLVAFAAFALVACVAWEAIVMHGSYWGQFLVDLPGRPAPVYDNAPPPPSAFEMMVANIRLLPAIGSVLLNVSTPEDTSSGLPLRIAATVAWVSGLALAVWRRIGITEVYVAVFAAMATFHIVHMGETDQNRLLVPIIPFLFAFVLEALDELRARLARLSTTAPVLLRGALAVYVAAYVILGLRTAIPGVREAHFSPFGSYPIKRPGNYDIERLALWLKANSPSDERFASAQADMLDVIIERRGTDIVSRRAAPPDAFVTWLDGERVRYLFVDHTIANIHEPVMAAVRAYPSRFRLVRELRRASLYEIEPR